jgi:hypothetical protein
MEAIYFPGYGIKMTNHKHQITIRACLHSGGLILRFGEHDLIVLSHHHPNSHRNQKLKYS